MEAPSVQYCHTDIKGCITWDEMEKCVEEIREYLRKLDIPLPSKEEFDTVAGDDECVKYGKRATLMSLIRKLTRRFRSQVNGTVKWYQWHM